jgi:DNA-binding transcriptional ArsR family regulator
MADLDEVMRALSARTRREILSLIWDTELAAGQIAAEFDLAAATISEHLAVLREAGLVEMTRVGTSRRYRARQEALAGLHGAMETTGKWTPADDIPERHLTATATTGLVLAAVEVTTDVETTFRAFTDDRIYSRWLEAPVMIRDGRFAATMEWGTEIRGRYELVVPPRLIVMAWDFEDDNVPVPGSPLMGYLWVHPADAGGSRVEVQQLVTDAQQAAFMDAAWGMVLGRLKSGVVAATRAGGLPKPRPRRRKTRASA